MKLLKLWLLIALLAISQQVLALNEIKNVRIWPSPDNTRLVLDLSKKVKYKISNLDYPECIVINFVGTKMATNLDSLPLHGTGIKKIHYAVHSKHRLRIVLEVEQKFKVTSFILAPNERYGHRLVLDLDPEFKDQQVKANPVRPQDVVIAIDAGHGGEDSGAIGPRGTKEKDIVLSIAKQLKHMIDQQPGMHAVLIRDYYLGFRERIQRARAKNADLFISIHADAFAKRDASGVSVFTLSSDKYSSVATRWLAASENRADLMGGVSLNDKSDMLATVLFDLSQTANSAASLEAAQHVLYSLGENTALLHTGIVESGAFLVLRSPDVPSILVGAGFISNPKMEAQLRDKDYQNKLAFSIFHGVSEYFQTKQRRVA